MSRLAGLSLLFVSRSRGREAGGQDRAPLSLEDWPQMREVLEVLRSDQVADNRQPGFGAQGTGDRTLFHNLLESTVRLWGCKGPHLVCRFSDSGVLPRGNVFPESPSSGDSGEGYPGYL